MPNAQEPSTKAKAKASIASRIRKAGKVKASKSTAGKPRKTVSSKSPSKAGKAPKKKEPIVRKNNPLCDSLWSNPISAKFIELQDNILKYTDIVTVGPAGFKPLHDGHLLVIEKAFIEARKIKLADSSKTVLVLINTSCAGRLKGNGFKIPRGKMYTLWSTFITPILLEYSKEYGVEYAVSFAHDGALKWLKETDINIYSIYSVDNKDIIIRIFGPFVEDEAGIQKFGNVIGIEQPRDEADGLSGTKAREYLSAKTKPKFLTLTTQFPNRYFEALISGGGRKAKTAKLKAKRKAKTVVKRKAKTVVKRTHSKKKSKINNNSNIVLKKGYCEATILDENEPDDPCDIHTTENECINETQDSDYWRSYDCKWKN
jgi:hypothetical protein